ncbi:MAG: hypothetical protein HY062_05930 [Bacteroidetes bacterium]|nr:hypothetical protein [Bacteroidota bacterium]
MKFYILFLFSLFALSSFAQTESATTGTVTSKKKRGNFYAAWGYTRCWYSKSDIHFIDKSNKYHPATGRYNDYDFTIYDAKAKDRPDFDAIKDVINITIPQFVVHAGYYFNNKKDFGIEINYDHAKYVVTNYQKVHIKGNFNGNYVDQDTILDPANLVHFEHTDGANFWMVNFIKRWKLYEPSKYFNVGFVVKPGAGFVYPRTDVTMFGERLNNNWHIAGWIVGVESGLRVEFLKHGMFEFVGKGVYADYRKCLVLGKGNGTANHHFFAAQLTMTLGLMF